MKKITLFVAMSAIMVGSLASMTSCKEAKKEQGEFKWVLDTFDDVRILRYKVPGFEELPLEEKILVYYMNEAALCGRDIMFDQNGKYNLAIRRTLEAIHLNHKGEKSTAEWAAFEKYLKKVWFSNGIHHHYSSEKFIPEFSKEYFAELVNSVPAGKLPSELGNKEQLLAVIMPVMFDANVMPLRINQAEGADMLLTSAMNYYDGVTQAEAEAFYTKMADPKDKTPISYGLNSQLTKIDGKVAERVWKVGGMYSGALEKIVDWLEKAAAVAKAPQKETIKTLISYYKTGDLREFDKFNIMWLQDTLSNVDFVNGFTETYGDPLGYKASWESIVNFKNMEATKRTEIISDNAQWFEDNSPIDNKFKKKTVKGVSAKVITAAILAGDCYPATPIGINLPNADWIRRDHGSKSVTIQNITDAYAEAAKGGGFMEEFVLRAEDLERIKKYGGLGDNLHTDMHECLGHGSGQLAPGTRGDELKNYGSPLEESRADLFALYYMGDPKMIELGLIPSLDVAYATYAKYVMNGMMTQFTRIQPGRNVEQAHMRCRKLISEWCYEQGKAENVIEKVVKDGKTYIVVNDYVKLRALFGKLLKEIQKIKSTGDYEAGKALIEKHAIRIDPVLHAEVLERNEKLGLQPYSGFVNPVYTPVMKGGEIVDIKVEYTEEYVDQMHRYSKDYSFLPSKN